MNLPTWIQSSVDPTQISLSVESAGKSLVGIITLIAILKGMDPATAQGQYQTFIDQAAILVASGYTVFHTAQTLYGLLRKGFMFLITPATTPPAPMV